MSEIPLYDWVPGQMGRRLIYQGRTPSHIDPGCIASAEVLLTLLKRNKLTGQALDTLNELK